jgi:hypothetical protein
MSFYRTVTQLYEENMRENKGFSEAVSSDRLHVAVRRNAGLLQEEAVPTPLAETPYRWYLSTY